MTDFLGVSLAQEDFALGDLAANLARIRAVWGRAKDAGDDLVVFPEMALCGYPPQDLVQKPAFIEDCEASMRELAETFAEGPAALIGGPALFDQTLFNAVWVLDGGKARGIFRKWDLANTGVFDEKRQFSPGPEAGPMAVRGARIGVLIGEDAWSPHLVETLVESGAEILIVPSGSPYERGKYEIDRVPRMVARVVESGAPLAYLNLVGAQDELVFDGGSFALDQGGALAAQAPFFDPALMRLAFERTRDGWRCRVADDAPLATPPGSLEGDYRAMVEGLRGFAVKTDRQSASLALDGGVGSALALGVAVDALGPENVNVTILPGLETADRENAAAAAQALDCVVQTAPRALSSGVVSGAESQLRERLEALFLSAWAQQNGALVVGVEDKTEFALRQTPQAEFCPLKDLYKTRVQSVYRWRAKHHAPWMRGPDGAELPEALASDALQIDLGSVDDAGALRAPAATVDAILELLVEGEASLAEIAADGFDCELARVIEAQLALAEPWRRQAGPGPKLGPRAFGPDRRYPIANRWRDPS